MNNIIDFAWNGKNALRNVVKQSDYGSAEQAIASLAAFTHPETIRELAGENMFAVIRGQGRSDRGAYQTIANGTRVMLDDNLAPIDAFLWANNLSRSKLIDVQFNHIWSDSQNLQLFTNLVNICALPAFLSKLTDTDETVKNILRYRAYDLYHLITPYLPVSSKPAGYDELKWGSLLPAQRNVESIIRRAMKTKPKSRTVVSAKNLGWLFSKDDSGIYTPDYSL